MMLYQHLGAWLRSEHDWSWELAAHLLLNGIFFHMQSVMAYGVMGLISPVTQVTPPQRAGGRGRAG